MINSFTINTYRGDALTLNVANTLDTGFFITNVSGLGAPPANIIITELATSDGAIVNSSRLTPRNIVFDLVYTPVKNGEDLDEVRRKSYRIFPIKHSIELTIDAGERVLKTTGYIETNELTEMSKNRCVAQISIMCPDPYFYEAGDNSLQTKVFSSVVPGFEFPLENDSLTDPLLSFGETTGNPSGVIVYDGDAEIGVTLRIQAVGEAEGITARSNTTHAEMSINTDKITEITGEGITAGDEIIITTGQGQKSVTLLRNGVATNILNALEKTSQWLTLVRGDNIFAFSAVSGVANLVFSVDYRNVYEGV